MELKQKGIDKLITENEEMAKALEDEKKKVKIETEKMNERISVFEERCKL